MVFIYDVSVINWNARNLTALSICGYTGTVHAGNSKPLPSSIAKTSCMAPASWMFVTFYLHEVKVHLSGLQCNVSNSSSAALPVLSFQLNTEIECPVFDCMHRSLNLDLDLSIISCKFDRIWDTSIQPDREPVETIPDYTNFMKHLKSTYVIFACRQYVERNWLPWNWQKIVEFIRSPKCGMHAITAHDAPFRTTADGMDDLLCVYAIPWFQRFVSGSNVCSQIE